MIAEQLQAARAAHWRQQQSPILTLEDAEGWLEQHPLCLYLPRQAQLPAPAPSFVEACMGIRQALPGAAAIEQAQCLLTRLIASATVVPLNLLGTVSEQPDFLAHRLALPFVLALRADPDWKHAPQKSSGHKVSPLVLELWKVLDKEGALAAAQARETLGRELTEAAVLRALCELWQTLRISPVPAEGGQPARWEMLRVRHRRALETGSTTSQVTALSLLVSMYLQSVYAASSQEIEVFLSPMASRSRVREAVRGLSATRQIHTLSMDAETYYFLENGLPEFAPLAAPSAPAEAAASLASLTPRPRPRKLQATARPDLPAAPPSPSAPIFRRSKADRGPAPAPPQKTAPPAAGAGWKTPARPGRPAWKPAARPAAGGARPYARPSTARPDRPGAWSGAGKRERPAPWAQPGSKSGPASPPPGAGGRGDSPFPPAQKRRPGTAPANAGAPTFRPRAARGERGPGNPSRARPAPGRRGPARFDAVRFDASGRRGRPIPPPSPRSSGPRPPSPGGAGRDAQARPSAWGSDRPRAAGYARPGAKRGPGDRGPRPPFVSGSKSRPPADGASAKPGKAKTGDVKTGNTKPWKAKPWKARPGSAKTGNAKTGEPRASFRGRKPDRKKPGA